MPPTHWRDNLNTTMGPDWSRKAKDRSSWKELVRTFAQNWAVKGVDQQNADAIHLPTDTP